MADVGSGGAPVAGGVGGGMAFLGAWLQLSLLLSFPQTSETQASPAAKAKE